jgi:Protein kinase domain
MRTGDSIGGARILGTAGAGAMGVVYRGYQDSLDRMVAIKVVSSDLAANPEFRARFQREARSAAALNHPHIVGVYDAGEDHGRLYLTMQYIDGHDLASMLRQHGPMPPADAVAVVGQIAGALDVAHERRLVHRDVKPANIMVTRDGPRWHAYLTDFGITTQLGEAGLTRTGMAMGTLDYMAPEQLVGDPYDHRADVYALGAVLFQALTGRVPFPRETDAARIYAHLNAEVPDLATTLSPAVPSATAAALSSVVRRALAKQPTARFASAGELADAARAALHGEGTKRTARGAYTPIAEANRRSGRRALLLGGAGAVLAGAGAIYAVPRLIGDSGGAPKASSSATGTTLPDDVPAARPDPRYSRDFMVGAGAQGIVAVDDYVWVNNREDRTMSRIDLVGGTTTAVSVGGRPHDFVTTPGRVWVVVLTDEVVVKSIDLGTGKLTGTAIPLSLNGAGLLKATSDGKLAWLSHGNTMVRLDLDKASVATTVTVGTQVASFSLTEEALLVTDRQHKLFRLDPRTGREVSRPLDMAPQMTGAVQSLGKTYVGGGRIGFGELVGDRMPRTEDLRLKNYSIGVDDGGAWGIDVTTSQMRRLKPDLTGTIGAAVTDLHANDATGFHSTSTRLYVLDPSARTVRLFAVTPLRTG